MNHVYRVVFNHALKCMQVVSEFADGARTRARIDRRSPRLAPLVAGIALACAAPSAFAGLNGWNEFRGTIDNGWSNVGNWEFGEPTGGSVAAYIDGNRTAEVTATGERTNHIHVGYTTRGNLSILGGGQLTSATIFVGTGERAGTAATADGRITISGAGSTWTALTTIGVGHLGNGQVDVDNGGTLAIGTDAYVGAGPTGTGLVNVGGAASRFTSGQNLFLGNEGNGTVKVFDGAQMTSVTGYVGNTRTGVGVAEISGAGSHWVNTGVLNIGEYGTGTVKVVDGASAEVRGALYLGNQALSASLRSRGDLIVSGAESRFVQSGSETVVGRAGVGAIQVSDGASASFGATTLGMTPSGVGTARATGADSRLEALSLTLGVNGWGRVDVDNAGTIAVDDDVELGASTNGTGVLVVSGADSQFTAGGTLQLANVGYGTLQVLDGGQLTSAAAVVGTARTGDGTAEISGDGSQWLNTGALSIGELGKGVVKVLDGGRIDLQGDLRVGNSGTSASDRSRGDLLVSGPDSSVEQIGGTTVVGNAGVGVIDLSNGGTIALGNVLLGESAAGSGTVVVTGAGSTWRSDSLSVGESGQGSFTVSQGGSAAISGGIVLARNAGSTGTVTVTQDAVLDVGTGVSSAAFSNGEGTARFEMAGGTLRTGTELALDTAVLLSADSTFDVDGSLTASRAFSGPGKLYKTGTGTLTLQGDSTGWNSSLQVRDGALALANSAALGGGWLAMADGTTLALGDAVAFNNSVQLQGEVAVAVAAGETATLAGNVSGNSSSTLVKRDGGTLTLGGGTTGGLTRVEEGTLRVNGNALNGGNVEIESAGTFEIDTTRVLTYAGQFSGEGTLRQGRHFLTLTGDSSAFAGTTWVDAGVLTVQGALGGELHMENRALLTGTGSVGSMFLHSNSVLSPGASLIGTIGRLSVTGDLVFDPSATYQVDVAADGRSDVVDVAGTATLGDAGTVAVAAAGDWQVSTRYTVLSAADGVNGTFAGVTSTFAFLDPTLSYDANNVYLTMARNDIALPDVELAFPEVVVNDNQREVATAVEALGEGNVVYDAVVRLEVPQVVPAFDSLSGEVHAATRGALLQNRFLHDGIDRHLDGRAISGDILPGVRVWVAGSGGQLRTDATAANAATRVQQHGLMAGAGWQLGDTLELGVAGGQQTLDNRLRERAAVAETDATEYGVYANYRWQGLSLRGGVTRADYRTDTTRTAQVGTAFSENLLAREDATGTTAFVRAGWTFGGPRLQLTPEIELAQVRLESDGSQERGGDSALHLGAADSRYRTGLAALKADWDISGGLQDRAVLTARVGWQYADGDRLPTTTARFVGGAQDFTIAGAPLARSSVLAQLGVAVSPSANSRLSLQMQGRDGDGQRDVGAQLDWSVAF